MESLLLRIFPLIATFIWQGLINAQDQSLSLPYSFTFEAEPKGLLNEESFKRDYRSVRWTEFYDRISISGKPGELEDQCLQAKYPKNTYGPKENGGQFLMELPVADEYYLSYSFYFCKGFDFRKGGKLPGLTSGGAKYTGGNRPVNGDGWSARFMWLKNGKFIIYLYYADMKGRYGEELELNSRIARKEWNQLVQHIRINQPGQSNGILEVWLNGKKVLSRNNIRFHKGEHGKIDSFYFSTFHGGNDPSWAPKQDSYILFDNVVIDTIPPGHSSGPT